MPGHRAWKGRCQVLLSSGTSASIAGFASRPETTRRGASATTRRACPRGRPPKMSETAALVLGADFQQEPGGALGEEQGDVMGGVVVAGHVAQRNLGAEAPGKRHLGQRDGQAALAEVVAGRGRGPRWIASCTARKAARPRPGSTFGTRPPTIPRTSAQCEPPSSRRVRPAISRTLPASFRSIVTHLRDVGDLAHRADEQGAGDGQALALVGVFVVEAVLARDERRAVGQGQVVAPLRRQDERAEGLGPLGVPPAEVVQQGDPRGVGADGHAVADRLVDDQAGHRIGVDQAVPRVDPARDGQAPRRSPDRQDHRGVAGAVVERRRPGA